MNSLKSKSTAAATSAGSPPPPSKNAQQARPAKPAPGAAPADRSSGEPDKAVRVFESPGYVVYGTDKPDTAIQEFIAPGAPRTEGSKPAEGAAPAVRPNGRARTLTMLRKEISSYLFEYLKGFHLPTHFLGSHSPTGILVKSTQPVPFQVAVVNTPPDTWKKRFGPMNGKRLEFPVLEYYLLDGGSAGTWINEYHAYAFDLATPDEMKQVSRLATKTNAVLRSLCERRGLSLRSIMISMGKAGDQILLTGELSPVTCKFADNRPRGGVADFGDGYTGPEEPVEVLYSMLRMKV